MDKEKIAQYFLEVFPDKAEMYLKHLQEYGELLNHIFYCEAINIPLFELLKTNQNIQHIEKYCSVIEYMWRNGDESIKNVVDVTILERLSDDPDVWQNFGRHISDSFKTQINNEWVVENRKWLNIESLK